MIIALQQIEADVFYPVIVGRRLALHLVATLLAPTVGGGDRRHSRRVPVGPPRRLGAAVFSYAREKRAQQSPVVTP